ncbi:MAG: hypothetical protein LQ351_005794 [Letrouitia transgressa]|nr:MAG: hypothetical protein LQ351_005794 [Letrouitia transgressa]
MDKLSLEVLDLTFAFLSSEDLKRSRLVCRAFTFPAEKHLFHTLYIYPNIDSFRKAYHVAHAANLNRRVRKLILTNLRLPAVYDFEDWRDFYLGHGWLNENNKLYLMFSLDLLELKYHYWQHDNYVAGQDSADEKTAVKKLLQTIALCCPHLREVELDYDGDSDRDYREGDTSDTVGDFNFLENANRRTRQLLAVPTYIEGRFGVREQFIALLTYPRALNVSGHVLPWKVFDPAENIVRKTRSSLKTLKSLSLEMEFPFRDYSRANLYQLADFIDSASNLRSLELSFDILPFRCIERTIRLDAVLAKRIHWPSLERLRLQAVSTPNKYFRDFLARHRQQLRSLELKHVKLREDVIQTSNIRIGNTSGKKELEHGSWIDLIKFLQADFNLQHVQLGGILSNCWNEHWVVVTKEELLPIKVSCSKPHLKERVEAWIVHGGSLPLAHFETTDKGEWKRLATDETWQFIPELMDLS